MSYGFFLVVRTACLPQDGRSKEHIQLGRRLRWIRKTLLPRSVVRLCGGGPMRYWLIRLWQEQTGQDMIEYALLAAALALIVAGFLPPQIMPSVTTIFSKITSSCALS
jgi:Flp pilus assembly pilin Flp